MKDSENYWKRIAQECFSEIEALHKDIFLACDELEKKMPKSFNNAIHILEKTVDISENHVRLLKIQEPIEKEVVQKHIIEKVQAKVRPSRIVNFDDIF